MKRAWWLLIVAGLLPIMAAAQDAGQPLDIGAGYEITLPASWKIDKSSEDVTVATGPDLSVSIVTPETVAGLIPAFANATDAVEALTAILETDDANAPDPAAIEAMQVGERTIAVVLSAEEDLIAVTVPLGESFGVLLFHGNADLFSEEADLIQEIIASFVVVEDMASSSEPCKVSVSTANSAALRVGPGEHRTSIAFLPANTDVTVTGRNEQANDAVWYQLDKTEAAPGGTAAAELWVNAESVEASGDCDAVADTDAPPVIPIPVAATAAPGEGQTPLLPDTGAWSIVLNPITNRSCAGRDDVAVSSSEIYSAGPFFSTISILNSDTFRVEGQTYWRVGGSNSFLGSFPDGGIRYEIRVDLASATSMSGDIVARYTQGGTSCSDTVAFSGTRG